ncbi:hypothetical protein [Actinoplanes palleronii]|uniref:Integral membrane protein n=1 Tax=Actinoplanes palleronii TaxID=113570 RepID=A0ABQ4BME5_9ACTN|nr:hypothetical protein [Actinoplanes palleronii]GIE71805.1 hypothetical protein Apa02nite_079130 [Actinoplanes palleronii]
MGVLNRLIAACLRAAARRWPADLRDDMAREWAAELSALEQRPGTAWRRLTFAVSLAATPMTVDESGAPFGRFEWMRAGATLRSAFRLLLAGAFGLGITMAVRMAAGSVFEADFTDDAGWLRHDVLLGTVTAALMTVYTVLVGRWVAARGPSDPGPAGSTGVAATVILPVAPMLPFFLVTETYQAFGLTLLVTACWTAAMFALTIFTVRSASAGRGARAWAGVPFAAALPALILLAGDVPDQPMYQVVGIVEIALFLLPWTVCAVVFGQATVRRWSAPLIAPAVTGPAEVQPAASPGLAWGWRFLLPPVAAAAAVVWALGVTVLQPLSEPMGVDASGENNTYWARESRWGALFALVMVLIVAVRGGRRATGGVLLFGTFWLALDIGLDRIDPTSGTVALAAGAAVAALAATVVTSGVPAVPRPQVLLSVAAVAAVMSGLITANESPTDTEPLLNPASAATGCLLAVVAVLAAVRAAGMVGRLRAIVAVPVAIGAAAGPWLVRHVYPQPSDGRLRGELALVALLVLAVVVLAAPRPQLRMQWLRYPGALAIGAVIVPVMVLPLVLMSIALPIGSLFTALAANPAVDAADEDTIAVLLAIPIGLALGRILRPLAFGRPAAAPKREYRKASGAPYAPVGEPPLILE